MSGAWRRNAVLYQIYLHSFADGDGDGPGDLPGLQRASRRDRGVGQD
jgi:alpha-glucosidase